MCTFGINFTLTGDRGLNACLWLSTAHNDAAAATASAGRGCVYIAFRVECLHPSARVRAHQRRGREVCLDEDDSGPPVADVAVLQSLPRVTDTAPLGGYSIGSDASLSLMFTIF